MSTELFELPLSDEEKAAIYAKRMVKDIVRKEAKYIAFASGQTQLEVHAIVDGTWRVTQVVIDGANFGDGLNSYAECFIDRSGLFASAAPLGSRLGSGYFGGFTPFMSDRQLIIRGGESIYLAVENGTDAEVSALVEIELMRLS